MCVGGLGAVSYLPLGDINIYSKPVVSSNEAGKVNISLHDILSPKK